MKDPRPKRLYDVHNAVGIRTAKTEMGIMYGRKFQGVRKIIEVAEGEFKGFWAANYSMGLDETDNQHMDWYEVEPQTTIEYVSVSGSHDD